MESAVLGWRAIVSCFPGALQAFGGSARWRKACQRLVLRRPSCGSQPCRQARIGLVRHAGHGVWGAATAYVTDIVHWKGEASANCLCTPNPNGGAAKVLNPGGRAQAVARLAQFTAEGPPGGAAPADAGRGADLFADHDPGDAETSLAGEPDVSIATFARRLVPPGTPSQAEAGGSTLMGQNLGVSRAGGAAAGAPGSSAAGAAGAEGPEQGPGQELDFTEVARTACAPHRLLAAQSGGSRALLGLIDDVDAAVVEVRLGGPQGGARAAEGAPAAAEHVASVPALAYVVEGAQLWWQPHGSGSVSFSWLCPCLLSPMLSRVRSFGGSPMEMAVCPSYGFASCWRGSFECRQYTC